MSMKKVFEVSFLAFFLAAILEAALGQGGSSDFRRGDSNDDGKVDISDPLMTFAYLFLGGADLGCVDASDSNDSGAVDLSDGIYTLTYLFLGGPVPPLPGPLTCGPDPSADKLPCARYEGPGCGPVQDTLKDIGHVLNRIGYGPTQEAVDHVRDLGIGAYIAEQLHPELIDESGNTALQSREDALFQVFIPKIDRRLVSAGDIWKYLKGTEEPPADWKTLGFADAAWLSGPTGIGFGDDDDATILTDMAGNYFSVYLRKTFTVADPAAVKDLIFRVDYDDGFVAYLNGQEIARRGLTGSPPLHTATAVNHEAGTPEEMDVTAAKGFLQAGANVLAIQVHNTNLNSGDLSMIPELIDREILPEPPRKVIQGTGALQQLVHVRGIYSRKQLQSVLAEFWENHFTTDVEKVADYLNGLQNSDASDAMSDAQAAAEAAQAEYREHQFFTENALGNFGDLLLYSATSPTMLIYLDNVLNVKGSANENYAREILELFAFGVDNRYTQKDIQELARCFTGWTLCKVAPGRALEFPESAVSPPEACGVLSEDTVVLGLGAGWQYFKGTAEPSPGQLGEATTGWTAVGFDDSSWTAGSTGIGYGDNDDATILSDMRNGYISVYLRRSFDLPDPAALENFIFEVAYDDGFVAYLNGQEIARSRSMRNTGTPPAFSQGAVDSHEVTTGIETFNLGKFRGILNAGKNVLAIQVHNQTLDSGDLSMLPRLLDRKILPGSVENGDPNGIWTFRFDPDRHDTSAKTLFQGTPYQIDVPAGRAGMAGLADALDVVQAMASHPSTAEFICIKLIQRFVSDEISLAAYKADAVPADLKALLAECIAAWNSTTPRGDIRKVLETILSPGDRSGAFWAARSYRAKVKSPVEFINSTLRVLDGAASGKNLPGWNDSMGMHLFTRDEPDGWPEVGVRWIDTSTLLARIKFGLTVSGGQDAEMTWSSPKYLSDRGLEGAEEIVDYFNDLLFQGAIPPERRAQLLEFLTTDDSYNPLPLDPAKPDFQKRVQEYVGFLLSQPEWNFQ